MADQNKAMAAAKTEEEKENIVGFTFLLILCVQKHQNHFRFLTYAAFFKAFFFSSYNQFNYIWQSPAEDAKAKCHIWAQKLQQHTGNGPGIYFSCVSGVTYFLMGSRTEIVLCTALTFQIAFFYWGSQKNQLVVERSN